MRIKKAALVSFLVLLLLLNVNIKTIAQEEIDNQATPIDQIEPDALQNYTKRSYDEGITIKEIDIVGNMLISKDKILDKMNTKLGTPFDRSALQDDLKSIYNMGYFTDNIKAIPEASSTGVKLRIELEENVPVTGVTITGNTVMNNAELEEIFKDQTGMPQNIAQLNQAISKIEEKYSEKGFVLARVKKISDDPDGMVNIEINEGVIKKIKFVGNTKTKDFVIKRNMLTAEGSVYNEELLKSDLKRIFGTQSFEDVRRVVSASTEDPDKYDVTVEVDEKRTGAISLGGGVDTGCGIFGSIGYTNPNFLGRGQIISAVAMVGSGVIRSYDDTIRRATLQFEGSFTEPRLKGTLNSLQVSAFGRNYASYQIPLAIEQRIGGEIEIARPIKRFRNVAGSFSLGVEKVKIKEGDLMSWAVYAFTADPTLTPAQAISDRMKELEGGTFLGIGPSLAYDTRNDALSPTSGWYHTIKLKESIGLGGDVAQFGRLYASFRKYFPIGKKSTLAFNFQTGTKLVGDMPEFAMYRLGGSNTIRGFREGTIGSGAQYILGSAEFRMPVPFLDKIKKIPLVDNIRAAAFFDAGKAFDYAISNKIFDRPGYGISAGLGLRVNIPGMGPIRVDYGIPFTKLGKYNGDGGRFNFGFGEKF